VALPVRGPRIILGMRGRVSSPRFVGRAAELTVLRDLLEEAIAGRPRLALVVGDAGIGKSRLVAEVTGPSLGARERPGRRPGTLRVLTGQCLAIPDGGLPYAPLTEALRQLARETDPETLDGLIGPARGELARLLPELAGGAAAPAAGPPGRADQARLFELVLGLLGRSSAETPTILVVEDLHWIDDATRALLTFLARNLRTERLLLIGTCRADAADAPPDLSDWLAELARSRIVARMDLGPLSAGEVGDQLEGILGSPPSRRLAGSIVARSGGNALFAEELLAVSRDGEPERLPATLGELLVARVRGLSDPARDVVRMLAIASRPVDERLLAASLGMPQADLVGALEVAAERHVASLDTGGGTATLRHVLLAEAIGAGLPATERRRLHGRFADALAAHPELADASPAGAAGELAAHLSAADRPAEALPAALQAARAARAVHAHSETWRQFQRAIELRDRLAARGEDLDVDLVSLLREAEDAADLAGATAESEALVRRGLEIVDVDADPRMAGVLHGRLGYQHWLAGRSHEELAEYRTAVALVPAEPPSIERARVLRGLGGALMGLGQYRESTEVCEAAIDAARAAGAPVEEGRALGMLGMDLVGLGDVATGIERLEQARGIAREHDPLDGLIVVLYNLALHLLLVDRSDEAVAAAAEGIEVARQLGLERRFGVNLRAVAADALLRLGRWSEVDALVSEGEALDPDGGGPLYLRIIRIRLATAQGRLDDARAVLAAATPLAEGDVDYDLVAYLRTADAELAYWDGRLADARDAVDAGLAILATSDDVFLTAPLIALGMRVEAERAEAARAWRDAAVLASAERSGAALTARIESLQERFAEGGREATPGTAAALGWAAAERERLLGRSDAAAWAAVATAWDGLGQPASVAYAKIREAEARLTDRDDRDAAARALRAASDGAHALGAAPLLGLAHALARRARLALDVPSATGTPTATATWVPPAAAAAPGSGAAPGTGTAPAIGAVPGDGRARLREMGLSERELEVLELVAAGRTNGQIAAELFISPKTASVHVTHILAKLGVGNRVEAAMVAARLGLEPGIEPDIVAPSDTTRRAELAFLFTDIVGSTALLEAIGDEAWTDLRAWHDATLRRLFTTHDGLEVDHAGDGFFVVFRMAGAAVACAVAIQRALAEHRRTAGFAPAVRIGIHAGDAVRSGGGYTGRDVHLAARLLARADAGRIVVTAETLRAAGRSVGSIESVELPGIAGPIEIAEVGWG
jgi:class 3 adenylate cyclase/tetratricopeptide (TPR) repeat protein